ncbi:Cache 3/Cache 2 fusion domain-containing protein [Stenotrophomonas rhizophila]
MPTLRLGTQAINLQESAVDRFAAATGGVATVFVREGDDFVRVSTSLRNAEGARALGTALDHANPAYASLLKGGRYTGPARLFGVDYMTHYTPITNAAGEVVGIAFVGQNYSDGLAALKARLRTAQLGKQGHFLAVDTRPGERFGSLIAAPSAEGELLATQVDAADLPALKALLAGRAEQATLHLRTAADGPAQAYFVSAQCVWPLEVGGAGAGAGVGAAECAAPADAAHRAGRRVRPAGGDRGAAGGGAAHAERAAGAGRAGGA